MTTLKIEGKVSARNDVESIFIGETDIIDKINEAFPVNQRVFVALGDERFDGDLFALRGVEGYSEWTPPIASEFLVGESDIRDRLIDREGEVVVFWISDEPINTLDPPPSWGAVEKE